VSGVQRLAHRPPGLLAADLGRPWSPPREDPELDRRAAPRMPPVVERTRLPPRGLHPPAAPYAPHPARVPPRDCLRRAGASCVVTPQCPSSVASAATGGRSRLRRPPPPAGGRARRAARPAARRRSGGARPAAQRAPPGRAPGGAPAGRAPARPRRGCGRPRRGGAARPRRRRPPAPAGGGPRGGRARHAPRTPRQPVTGQGPPAHHRWVAVAACWRRAPRAEAPSWPPRPRRGGRLRPPAAAARAAAGHGPTRPSRRGRRRAPRRLDRLEVVEAARRRELAGRPLEARVRGHASAALRQAPQCLRIDRVGPDARLDDTRRRAPPVLMAVRCGAWGVHGVGPGLASRSGRSSGPADADHASEA
jgi:hypothetical protein